MLIEEAFYSLLKTDPAINALVNDRIYPVTMPQHATYPAIVFDLGARERQQTHDSLTGLVRSHFTVWCVGPKYFETKILAERVRVALDGKWQKLADFYGQHVRGVFLENESDDYVFDQVESLSLYNVPMEFLVQHKEEI